MYYIILYYKWGEDIGRNRVDLHDHCTLFAWKSIRDTRQADGQTGLHADRQMEKTDRRTDRQAGKQAGRQASRQVRRAGKQAGWLRQTEQGEPGSRVLLLAHKLRLRFSFSILRLWYSRELPGISYAEPSKRLLFQPSGNSFNCPGRSRAL